MFGCNVIPCERKRCTKLTSRFDKLLGFNRYVPGGQFCLWTSFDEVVIKHRPSLRHLSNIANFPRLVRSLSSSSVSNAESIPNILSHLQNRFNVKSKMYRTSGADDGAVLDQQSDPHLRDAADPARRGPDQPLADGPRRDRPARRRHADLSLPAG